MIHYPGGRRFKPTYGGADFNSRCCHKRGCIDLAYPEATAPQPADGFEVRTVRAPCLNTPGFAILTVMKPPRSEQWGPQKRALLVLCVPEQDDEATVFAIDCAYDREFVQRATFLC